MIKKSIIIWYNYKKKNRERKFYKTKIFLNNRSPIKFLQIDLKLSRMCKITIYKFKNKMIKYIKQT
jgi:hypothetical protein